jgi:hypothetical protein
MEALRSTDPLALIRAVSKHDSAATPVVTDLIKSFTAHKRQKLEQALTATRRAVDDLEEKLVHVQSNESAATMRTQLDANKLQARRVAEVMARLSSADAADLARRLAGATSEEIERHLAETKVPLTPRRRVQVQGGDAEGPSLTAFQAAAAAKIRRCDFASAASLGRRAERVLVAARARNIDVSPLTDAMKALGVTKPLDLDAAVTRLSAPTTEPASLTPTNPPVEPFGYLHLERLDFIPSGVQHGELVYSLPLAPGEEVSILHKEWSNTDEEFTKLVSDQFEDYSEKGVVEHTDLSSASSSQTQHSSSFSLAVSVSGGYGPMISGSVSTNYSTQSSESQSREASIRQSNEVTKKASARSRKEHRVSFKLAKKTGVEDQTVRRMKNPDPVNPVRYDYYQLMRRWRVDLRRYGVRLTYDLTIPEPAVDLLELYRELAELETTIEKGFTFDLDPELVTRDTWSYYANLYGTLIEPPPPLYVAVQGIKIGGPWGEGEAHVDELHIKCPEGYGYYDETEPLVLRCTVDSDDPEVKGFTEVWWHNGNPMSSELGYGIVEQTSLEQLVSIRAWFMLEDDYYEAWRVKAYQTLQEAANKLYLENRQKLQERRARLLAETNGTDALTLRKLEREELMKNVIRWLFGPGFSFTPPGVSSPYYTDTGVVVDEPTVGAVLGHGQLISFLHQALEWENLNSFLYPYFWTPADRWRERLRIRHEDATHEAFLRAGAARIVLPIRIGWEDAFLSLISTGAIDTENHPYQTIAEEIQNYAHTNYPGIPSANPEEIDPAESTEHTEGRLIASWYEYTPTSAIDIRIAEQTPAEGAYKPPTFAPPPAGQPWWLDPAVAAVLVNALVALTDRLTPGKNK